MNQNLAPLVESFRGLRALVIGDVMLDVYLTGSTSRLCREAPVPVVSLVDSLYSPGGAANTAANLRALGAEVRLIGLTGDDVEADRLRFTLQRAGVGAESLLPIEGRRTLSKSRVIAGPQMLLRLDQGSTGRPPDEAGLALSQRLEEAFDWADVVVVSDYQYGVISPVVLATLVRLQKRNPRTLVVDGKNVAQYRDVEPTAIKPNYDEVAYLLGPSLPQSKQRVEAVRPLGDYILDLTGARIAAVTLDREGALVFERGLLPYRTYARPVEDSRAAGAGDTFIAALGLALAAGAQTAAAAEIASAASGIVVTREGTSVCGADDLSEAFTGDEKRIDELGRLAARRERWRQQGKRLVFTNGCFDIIHSGHISYLNSAKSLGDVLAVGVNSDASVRRLKGSGRPINGLDDRVQILSALSSVDCIVPFEEDSPLKVIEALRPDVFVKGGDYSLETLPEAPLVQRLGGRVEILPYVDDRSTTGIIGRIRAGAAV